MKVYHTAATIEELIFLAPLLAHPSIFELHFYFAGAAHSLSGVPALRSFPVPSPRTPLHAPFWPGNHDDVEDSSVPSTAAFAARYIPPKPIQRESMQSHSFEGAEACAGGADCPTVGMRGGEAEVPDMGGNYVTTPKAGLGPIDSALKSPLAGKQAIAQWGSPARDRRVRKLAAVPGRWQGLAVWIGSWIACFWLLVRFLRSMRV